MKVISRDNGVYKFSLLESTINDPYFYDMKISVKHIDGTKLYLLTSKKCEMSGEIKTYRVTVCSK